MSQPAMGDHGHNDRKWLESPAMMKEMVAVRRDRRATVGAYLAQVDMSVKVQTMVVSSVVLRC